MKPIGRGPYGSITGFTALVGCLDTHSTCSTSVPGIIDVADSRRTDSRGQDIAARTVSELHHTARVALPALRCRCSARQWS
jgi:hypothetical protein